MDYKKKYLKYKSKYLKLKGGAMKSSAMKSSAMNSSVEVLRAFLRVKAGALIKTMEEISNDVYIKNNLVDRAFLELVNHVNKTYKLTDQVVEQGAEMVKALESMQRIYQGGRVWQWNQAEQVFVVHDALPLLTDLIRRSDTPSSEFLISLLLTDLINLFKQQFPLGISIYENNVIENTNTYTEKEDAFLIKLAHQLDHHSDGDLMVMNIKEFADSITLEEREMVTLSQNMYEKHIEDQVKRMRECDANIKAMEAVKQFYSSKNANEIQITGEEVKMEMQKVYKLPPPSTFPLGEDEGVEL